MNESVTEKKGWLIEDDDTALKLYFTFICQRWMIALEYYIFFQTSSSDVYDEYLEEGYRDAKRFFKGRQPINEQNAW